jgi:penicillin-binding protein A
MNFTREIRRVLLLILLAFGVVGLSAAYWSLFGADDLLARNDNPRLVEAEAAIRRGSLYDRNGVLLAQTVINPDPAAAFNQRLLRRYPYAAMNSALGYFSLRYGVGGAEAAYDAILRGDTLPDTLRQRFEQAVLHRPQVGSDVRLTFDVAVQQSIVAAMGDAKGAAVVLAAPSGDLLALVSQPTYDPSTLDADWDELVAAPGEPFFNRVLQGQYQPGGSLQTPLLAAALLADYDLSQPIANAKQPVSVGDVSLRCTVTPALDVLTTLQAYAYGCPYPFEQLITALPVTALAAIFETLQLDQPPTLAGFVADPPNETPEITPEATPQVSSSQRANALGQGDLRVNPLAMAGLAAALVNDGNAPHPHALQATRAPDSDWQTATFHEAGQAMLTAAVASQLRTIMQAALPIGAAQAAQRDSSTNGPVIGGHAALAYSGETTQAWFVGFVVVEGRLGAGVAIVLENSDDLTEAARVGGVALRAAHDALIPSLSP